MCHGDRHSATELTHSQIALLKRRTRPAENDRMRLPLALCLIGAVIAAGCGSPSDSKVDQLVAKSITVTSGHPVSSAICTKGITHPPVGAPQPSASDRTCRVSFSDGTKPQVWAVRVTDLSVTSTVDPLYRLDAGGPGVSADDLKHSAAAAFAIVSGKRVVSVSCRAESGLKAGADHRCRAVFADHSHSIWAVRASAAGAQLLYPIG
ncbi:MAG: hypothetical protein QOG33_1912 [Gaiellales bacterium]|nr:hypothetical protein [Gaiellales bacterium]